MRSSPWIGAPRPGAVLSSPMGLACKPQLRQPPRWRGFSPANFHDETPSLHPGPAGVFLRASAHFHLLHTRWRLSLSAGSRALGWVLVGWAAALTTHRGG